MRDQTEKELLIRAVDSFKRQVVIISPDYEIKAVNHPDDQLKSHITAGKICYQAIYNRSAPCPGCVAQRVLASGRSAVGKEKTNPFSLETFTCLYASPIFNENEITHIALLDFPIAGMGEIAECLHQANEFLNNLITSAVDAIIASDMTGKILIFNDAACEISGYDVADVIGKMDIRDIYPGAGAKTVMAMLRSDDFGGKGTLRSCQVDILDKDGALIPINLNARIIYEGRSEIATLGFFHDRRDALKMEAELEKTRSRLLQAEKMASLGELAAGVAHQLNNPLGGIALFTQLILEDYELPEGAVQDLERVLKDTRRCGDIVQELLNFSRQAQNQVENAHIHTLLDETLFLVKSQHLFKDIDIVKTYDPKLPQVPVDIQKIKHVFVNIMLNAADAMEKDGRLTIKTSYDAEHQRAVIRFSDTGPGMEEAVLKKVFTPFFTTKEPGKGTGLGLSFAFRIVEDHGGVLSAQSPEGQGAVFTLELPIQDESVKEAPHGNA